MRSRIEYAEFVGLCRASGKGCTGQTAGATRRDRTGDLLITNRAKWYCHQCPLLPAIDRKARLERV